MCLSPLLPLWSCCSDRRKSLGPSAPIAYATSVSPPDEAAAWPGCRCWMLDMAVAWPGAAFLQITFHAGCRHTHFWQGVAWMVRPICAHRAQLQKLIIRLLGIYILKAWKVICRKAHVMLPDANFLSSWCQSPSSRAQNRGFCAREGVCLLEWWVLSCILTFVVCLSNFYELFLLKLP